GEPGVLRRAFLDPGLQQGQEQVGLAVELRVDHALGKASLVGDLLQRRGMVAASQEDPPGGVQDQSPVAFGRFGPAQAFHTIGTIILMVFEWEEYSNVMASREGPSRAIRWADGGPGAYAERGVSSGTLAGRQPGGAMFERFTDRSRRVVVQAQDQARALSHD